MGGEVVEEVVDRGEVFLGVELGGAEGQTDRPRGKVVELAPVGRRKQQRYVGAVEGEGLPGLPVEHLHIEAPRYGYQQLALADMGVAAALRPVRHSVEVKQAFYLEGGGKWVLQECETAAVVADSRQPQQMGFMSVVVVGHRLLVYTEGG